MKVNPTYKKWLKRNMLEGYYKQRVRESSDHIFLWALGLFLGAFVLISGCLAQASEYTDKEIVEAIYVIEGKEKASKPYGIMLPKCSWKNKAYCEKACYQTVANNRVRYSKARANQDYISFLAKKYAPVEAHPLNKNWEPNLRKILEKNRKNKGA